MGEQHTPTAGIVFIVDSSLLVLLLLPCPVFSWDSLDLCERSEQGKYILRVFVSIRARLWEIEAHVVFFSEKPHFSNIFNKKMHFALFICQYGFFFVPLRAFYGVLAFVP